MLERADAGVGEILRKLDALGLANNTLVIFTNDNGGEWLSRNAPLFHRKDTLWEGGIRVPAIFRWPGAASRGQNERSSGHHDGPDGHDPRGHRDAGPANARLEGVNLLPVLQGRRHAARTLFWRINVPTRQQRAVRRGDWKLLIDGDDLLLYNLRSDIGERNDVAMQRPDLVGKLRALVADWEKDVDAEAKMK